MSSGSSRSTRSSVLYATLFRTATTSLSSCFSVCFGREVWRESFYHTFCSKLCTVLPSCLSYDCSKGLERSGASEMLDIQLGIVVRTCSGSFVVPVGTGSFLCVSALKVSASIACFLQLCLCTPVLAERREHRTVPVRTSGCSRGLNEGGCARRSKSSRPLGLTRDGSGSSTSMATSSPVCCVRDCDAW